MTPKSVPTISVINITNRVLYKLVRKRFGTHITIRINSLHFLSNCYKGYDLFVPEIKLKSSICVSLGELNSISKFLINQLNTILKITETGVNVKIINVRILTN
jgi:hypothetical protein